MSRKTKVAAAQVGAIYKDASMPETVRRLIKLLQEAADKKVQLLVYPEATLTTFFPRHFLESQEELDKDFEHSEDIITSEQFKPLFDVARARGVDICLGYAERTPDGTGYNTSVYYSATQDKVISKYRKVHLPGRIEPFEDPEATNQLEKRYFKPGDLGFTAFRARGETA